MKKAFGLEGLGQYDHAAVEKKWQDNWAAEGTYKTSDSADKQKFYILDMFPYPSGEGLHVGHPKGYIATDIMSRMKRMQGFNVLHPMGFDAFGLPAENYAIKTKTNPVASVAENVLRYKKQLEIIGLDYDWSREVNTTDPKFYKWTQWIFLKLLEKGLAYESNEPVNWCPKDKTVLANEDVENGRCERCGTLVEKKALRQWVLKITEYADRLLNDLDLLDWPESIKESQRNWIGRSEGAEITFEIGFDHGQKPGAIPVFTTRPDTLFGVTYMVLSPEHLWVTLAIDDNHIGVLDNRDEVRDYVAEVKTKSEIERTDAKKEKTGVQLKGVYAVNPVNGEKIPLWIADYVLADYGTGAVMAVPAHDERDFAFAQRYNLPIKEVIEPVITKEMGDDAFRKDEPISERRAVLAFIKHWSEDKYLCVKWNKTGWQGFITGGIEEGEDIAVSAQREIAEETGYKNARFVKTFGRPIHARFYQLVKKQNRLAHFEPALFQLENGERGEISEEEKALFVISWLKPEEISAFITHPDMHIAWNRVQGKTCITDEGILVNSGKFDGKMSEDIKKEITEFAGGKWVTKYKLRDWVFSRQRYWGEPIPVFHDTQNSNAVVPVLEKDLPVLLPPVESYEPTDNGDSPLVAVTDWVNVGIDGKILRRETNTMPSWAGSSWYYLRYMDPHNDNALVNPEKEKYWNSVDLYVGGAEHATRHLIYARFWHKFLYDIGVVSTKEPFHRLQSVGLIIADDGRKMSKRFGNVINPDDVIRLYGADTFRMYEMFLGPFDQTASWSTENIIGTRRFLEKVWRLYDKVEDKMGDDASETSTTKISPTTETLFHKTIQKIGDDIAAMRFNTCVSSLMILVNAFEKEPAISSEYFQTFLKLLAPFAPHMAEELWSAMGQQEQAAGSIHHASWPEFDPAKLKDETATIAIQINGKTRVQIVLPTDSPENAVLEASKALPEVQKWLRGQEPIKVIYVKNRLINLVVAMP